MRTMVSTVGNCFLFKATLPHTQDHTCACMTIFLMCWLINCLSCQLRNKGALKPILISVIARFPS